MLDSNDFEGTRRVIDVSGDGPNNFGRLVTIDRDVAVASGITINGLPIINDRDSIGSVFALPDLDKYYQGCVIGGPGAFMVVAKDFKDYARAMRRKLIFEIAGVSPPPNSPRHARARTDGPVPVSFLVPAAANTGYTYERGCDVGERLWQRYWGNQFNDIP
jgi:hypothetical protein